MTNSSPTDLSSVAAVYSGTIIEAIQREYPNDLRHPMQGPEDRPTPRQVHPSFYGCYDWHSCVEMHWALVRLLRSEPDQLPAAEVNRVLDRNLDTVPLATEAAYFDGHPGFKRPYGWGWALMLAEELADWKDPRAHRWSANLTPLSSVITSLFLRWLPRATYPSRDGAHGNSAFGCARAIPWARRLAANGEAQLLDALHEAAFRWFGDDRDYPAAWEPGGADFLSPALAEAELMAAVTTPDEFTSWLDGFLPRLEGRLPPSLFTSAIVSDARDGQIAHLHGLNLYRAFAWRTLAERLPAGDARIPVMLESSLDHLDASLAEVCGGDYMVEHWLACYAVLALSARPPKE